MALTRVELAEALGISQPMVSRLVKRGMPADDVDAARRWRRRHLDPARVKGTRADTRAPATVAATYTSVAATSATSDLLALDLAHRLAGLAECDFEAWADDLRAALRALPLPLRASGLQLPVAVLEHLLATPLAALDLPRDPAAATQQPDADADAAGAFLIALAAGDLEAASGGALRAVTPAGRAVLLSLAA